MPAVRRVLTLTTFALALALAVAGNASAQSRWEPRDGGSRQAMADFASCVAKARPALAARAVIEDWDGEALFAQGRGAMRLPCRPAGGRALRYQFGDLRAALADRMLARDPALTVTPAQLSGVRRLAYRMPWPVRTKDETGRRLAAKAIAGQSVGYNRRAALISGQQIAECVVRASPASARALFATPIASGAEGAALNALAPALAPCTAAANFTFDRNSLRGSLAMAYYRLAMAGRGQAWPGVAARATGAAR